MNRLFMALAVAGALVAGPALAQDATVSINGTWRMTSLDMQDAAGQMQNVPYSGQVIFTEGGTMSVQAMNPDPNAPDGPYTLKGYEAYYGPVTIDETEKTFEVTIESAAVRDLIGQKFERVFEVSGDQLVLTPTNPDEHWRVTYERD
jgi:Lipocalin-like domain